MKRFFFFFCAVLALAYIITPFFWIKAETVLDGAEILSTEEETEIRNYHRILKDKYEIDYHILTSKNSENINIFATEYFNNQSIGATRGGLLLVVDPVQNLVRLEVSSSLEPVYTDAFVSYIEHYQMIPYFRAGKIATGILATTEMIFERAIKAKKGEAFDESQIIGSKGGGAVNNAKIGIGPIPKSNKQIKISKGLSPKEILLIYRSALKDHNNNPELTIFSAATQEIKKGWISTAAQMDNEAEWLENCDIDNVFTEGNFSVIRHVLNQRICPPYFFVKEQGEWKLDFKTMSEAIRFNYQNEWYFDKTIKHPYSFAFKDWKFEEQGFPYKE